MKKLINLINNQSLLLLIASNSIFMINSICFFKKFAIFCENIVKKYKYLVIGKLQITFIVLRLISQFTINSTLPILLVQENSRFDDYRISDKSILDIAHV